MILHVYWNKYYHLDLYWPLNEINLLLMSNVTILVKHDSGDNRFQKMYAINEKTFISINNQMIFDIFWNTSN